MKTKFEPQKNKILNTIFLQIVFFKLICSFGRIPSSSHLYVLKTPEFLFSQVSQPLHLRSFSSPIFAIPASNLNELSSRRIFLFLWLLDTLIVFRTKTRQLQLYKISSSYFSKYVVGGPCPTRFQSITGTTETSARWTSWYSHK